MKEEIPTQDSLIVRMVCRIGHGQPEASPDWTKKFTTKDDPSGVAVWLEGGDNCVVYPVIQIRYNKDTGMMFTRCLEKRIDRKHDTFALRPLKLAHVQEAFTVMPGDSAWYDCALTEADAHAQVLLNRFAYVKDRLTFDGEIV